MAKETQDMEKKTTSSPAKLSSCEPKSKDNGRGNGNKTQRYNKGRREPPQGRSIPDPTNGSSRRPAPQKSRALDKRPRSRGLPASRRDEMTHNQRAEFGSALAHGPKKINLNHLINFTFAPRQSEESRVTWRGRNKWGHRHARYNKEQFLQANCQFVVKSSGDYKQQSVDPDSLVDWDCIEQVCILSHEVPSCPICLFPPTAAKITKCGHIYCWPCILHYLSLGEKPWRKCPICYDSVVANDLKSVVAKSLRTYAVGDEITMRLMKREKGSVITQPHFPDRAPADMPSLPLVTDEPEETCFAKLLVATPEQVNEMIVGPERQALEKQLKESSDDFEKSFIECALDSLKKREEGLGVQNTSSLNTAVTPDQNVTEQNNSEEESPDVKIVTHPVKEDCIVYASAFSDDELDETEDDYPNVTDDSPTPDAALDDSTMATKGNDDDAGKDQKGEPSDDTDEKDPGDHQPLEKSDAEASPPPEVGAVGGGRKMYSGYNPSVYFYQAEDGQHLYLGSLNARCLIKEYGGLEHCPLTITARLVELQHLSVTQDMRTRMRHLQHLPLTCEICVCELDLRPPILSPKTLAEFATDIQKRKQSRDKKARDEKRRERKMKQEQDRKNGVYHKPRYSLQSTRQFPSFSGSPGASFQPDPGPGPGPPRPISPSSVDSGASSTFSAPLSASQEDDLYGSLPASGSEVGSPPSSVISSSPAGGSAVGSMAGSAAGVVAGGNAGGVAGGVASSWPAVSSPDSQSSGGHRSFAQMLRDGMAKPTSPVKASSTGSTPRHQAPSSSSPRGVAGREPTSSNESDNEDYVPVPLYKEAFSNAIQDALDKAAQLSRKKDDEPGEVGSSGGGGRKNKKGRKKQLLFSTAGPRFK